MPNILDLISSADLLAFSQNLSIARPAYLGDRLFPDQKTANLKAEYLRLANGANLPVMATVHAFDTEAEIGSRPAFDKVSVEKLLIKRKINQTEKVRMMLEHGVSGDDAIVGYVFDDMRMMADSVKVRTEVAKMEVLATGKMTINENHLNMTVDYGVPAGNVSYELNLGANEDIIGQIQVIIDDAANKGYTITELVTSSANVRKMSSNKGIQTLIFGSVGQGAYVTRSMLSNLFADIFGFGTITTNDLTYKYQKANGTEGTERFYDKDKVSFIAVPTLGMGLWGVTPEEAEYGQYNDKSANQYITLTQWATQDPVAVWTKASGLFIPVLPDPQGLFVATVVDSDNTLGTLTVTSVAGTATGATALTASPAKASGNVYKYKVGDAATPVVYGQSVKTWSNWDGSSDITAATGKVLTLVEADSEYKAVAVGSATVTAKA